MLIIREEHIEAFKKYSVNQFVKRTEAHLKAAFPEHPRTRSQTELRALISDGIETAKGYRITGESDVRRYIELAVEYGPDFHQAVWAAAILEDAGLSASRRVDRLEDYTVYVMRP